MVYPNINAETARNGLNQATLAQCLGVNRRTVNNWMTRGSIPMAALIKMSQLFGCSIDYLLKQ